MAAITSIWLWLLKMTGFHGDTPMTGERLAETLTTLAVKAAGAEPYGVAVVVRDPANGLVTIRCNTAPGSLLRDALRIESSRRKVSTKRPVKR